MRNFLSVCVSLSVRLRLEGMEWRRGGTHLFRRKPRKRTGSKQRRGSAQPTEGESGDKICDCGSWHWAGGVGVARVPLSGVVTLLMAQL